MDLEQTNVKLIPLQPDDREQFILEENWNEDDEMFVFRKELSD